MAVSCNLGAAYSITLFSHRSITPYRTKSVGLKTLLACRGFQSRHDSFYATSFMQKPLRSAKLLVVHCSSSSAKNCTEADTSEETKPNGDQIILSSPEVELLLATICDTTSIAEFKLNLFGFRLYVKRDPDGKTTSLPSPSPPPIQTNYSSQVLDQNGFAATTSLAISKPKPSPGSIQKILDTSSDEGLAILQSPKVGFFRRSRTIKGKRAPPSCKEKQKVKEGQVLCYIEQLGGEIPIESDVSGEVIKILRRDGEPVGYGDALIAILPSFPGIKKLH